MRIIYFKIERSHQKFLARKARKTGQNLRRVRQVGTFSTSLSSLTVDTKSDTIRIKRSQKQVNGIIFMIFIHKKCIQSLFYSLTGAEKHTILLFYRPTGSDFSMFSPAKQIIKSVLLKTHFIDYSTCT